jgi:hypothetical protein
MGALIFVSSDILAHGGYLDPMLLEVSNPFVEVFFVARKFQNHHAFFAGQYGRLEDVEGKVIVNGEIAYDGFPNFCFGKLQNEHSGVHRTPLSISAFIDLVSDGHLFVRIEATLRFRPKGTYRSHAVGNALAAAVQKQQKGFSL